MKGPARSILSELNQTERRDYDSLVRSLNTRYGSVERAEIFRTQNTNEEQGRIHPRASTSYQKINKASVPKRAS